MSSESKPFRLSATLAGHSQDGNTTSTNPCTTLVSSSRDGTARSWTRTSSSTEGMQVESSSTEASTETGNGGPWKEGVVFEGHHQGFVNAVQWFKLDGRDYLATAGQDKLIHVWPLPSSSNRSATSKELSPEFTLIGHENNVCALAASDDGKRLISGSWDKTAKVWKDFQLTYTLQGHEQSVWAVLALEGDGDDLVLTGAADNLVKLWKGSTAIRTYRGHTQAVRALARLSSTTGGGDLFASAGNDASIRLWSLTSGETVHTLYGHDSFIYSLSPIPDEVGGGLISGGEDRTMRIWRATDGHCEQTIVIPAVSVWTVKVLPDGDIAAGSSDGLVRVFTRNEERVADAETLKSFDDAVSKAAVNSSQIGDIEKDNLPGLEALGSPGRKDGQVIMVKAPNGTVEAHSVSGQTDSLGLIKTDPQSSSCKQWSNATGTWTKIGEVTGGVSQAQKQMYEGVEYDYVFDVDFADGAPKLKLPYNNGQNAYDAAQKFLIKHELPLEYTEQVVAFIDKNIGPAATLGQGTNEYVDPYTGASRYTGGGVATGSGSGGAALSGGFSGDPYTGGGRTMPAVDATTPTLLPHRSFLTFPQANLAALRSKLGQLNDQIAADGTTSSKALSSTELTSLDNLIAYLLVALGSPKPSQPIGEAEQAVILKLLSWPSAQRFPGLDLVRLVSLSTPLVEALPDVLDTIRDSSGPVKEQETNTMLGYRALANSFLPQKGKEVMRDQAVENRGLIFIFLLDEQILLTLTQRALNGLSKNGKIALATVALNLCYACNSYSIFAVERTLSSAATQPLLNLITALLRDSDGETIYRSLIALGNLLYSPLAKELSSATSSEVKRLAKEAGQRVEEARCKVVLGEIEKR
ncbi:BQ5605_C023g09734 [Microbotryum silenes-dioicae]|uniref:BQ5605_C023g09734 protein n=1 Tax=Microbotryum silenes-dioicae TaxID=796604 RepID=A0A2X0PF58_9BASI|nr:BQ5605_C023g09734 [Microbotryum silenes-dioicae]